MNYKESTPGRQQLFRFLEQIQNMKLSQQEFSENGAQNTESTKKVKLTRSSNRASSSLMGIEQKPHARRNQNQVYYGNNLRNTRRSNSK